MKTAEGTIELDQYLTFLVAGEEYAIDVLRIKEIIRYDALTTLPGAPPSVRGVINLRGSVVPVVDLALRFGLARTEISKLTCIIIVEAAWEGEKTVMGLMTDSVSQVMDIPPSQVEKPPSFGSRTDAEYLRGMGRAGKKFIMLLDIDKVLSAGDLRVAVENKKEE